MFTLCFATLMTLLGIFIIKSTFVAHGLRTAYRMYMKYRTAELMCEGLASERAMQAAMDEWIAEENTEIIATRLRCYQKLDDLKRVSR